jgi:hypothetical protein
VSVVPVVLTKLPINTCMHTYIHMYVHTYIHTYIHTYNHATGWTVRGSNPGGRENFLTCPDWPWGPPRLLYNGYQVSLPGCKVAGAWRYHPPLSSAEVKERVELHPYSHSGPSWPVLGWTLPFIRTYIYTYTHTHMYNVHTCHERFDWGIPSQQSQNEVVPQLVENNSINNSIIP